jgi:hypothetical protein
LDQRGWQKACTRFGLDCPIASVSRRIASYGNTDDVLEIVKKFTEEFKIRKE